MSGLNLPYGTTETDEQRGSPSEGMRGERAAMSDDPALRHQVTLENGRKVTVQEASGTAFVDATRTEPVPGPDLTSDDPGPNRMAWSVGAVGLLLGFAMGLRQGRAASKKRVETRHFPTLPQPVPTDEVTVLPDATPTQTA